MPKNIILCRVQPKIADKKGESRQCMLVNAPCRFIAHQHETIHIKIGSSEGNRFCDDVTGLCCLILECNLIVIGIDFE